MVYMGIVSFPFLLTDQSNIAGDFQINFFCSCINNIQNPTRATREREGGGREGERERGEGGRERKSLCA